MANTSFDEFVQREQQAIKIREEKPVDWEAEKDAWLRNLDKLFDMVNGFLKPYIEAGQVSISYRDIKLNEEYIGSYLAKEMLVTIGRKTVRLVPIGTLLIGSKGRVDIEGPVARAQLILLNSEVKSLSQLLHVSVSTDGKPASPPASKKPSQINWVWRILTRPPRREIVEISKESFLNLLTEISNG